MRHARLAIPVLVFLLGLVVFAALQQTTTHAFQPVYYANPVQGAYPFIKDEGSVIVNGYAYSYATLDLGTMRVGDNYTFLPALNSQIGEVGSKVPVVITFQGTNAPLNTRGFWVMIYIPLYKSTIKMGGYGDPRAHSTGFGTIGNARIFAQTVWIDNQTVKLYCYVGYNDTPQAPYT